MEELFNYIGELVQTQGWLAFPACFLGGIISSSSPYVLAMIPLVKGYVGGCNPEGAGHSGISGAA